MSEDDSDDRVQHGQKRKINQIIESDDTGSSADGPESPVIGSLGRRLKRRNRTRPVISAESDESDSGSSIGAHRRKRVPQINSDTGESVLDSSSSSIITRAKRPGRILSDSENDSESSPSQWETDSSGGSDDEPDAKVKNDEKPANDVDSDSSDGTSDKCPICLLSFKSQEVGSPESCDHLFCADCIQEWSKTMNTCPVDRQKFTIILVRRDATADKIVRQIPVQPPSPQNDIEIIEDPTFCEICGSSDREDRMLLCDECDLGFHLECLTPPLEDVPSGNWYCPGCEGFSRRAVFGNYGINAQFNRRWERDDYSQSNLQSRIARTRHNERLRSRIRNNRSINTNSGPFEDNREDPNAPSSSGMASDSLNVTSTSAGAGAGASLTGTRRPARKSKKKRKKRSKRGKTQRYRIVYEYDEVTGETVPIKKRMRKKRSRRRIVVKPRSVKKRLALQLGICSSSSVPQSIPDMKIHAGSNNEKHGRARFQAGILPALSLFGNPDELDYFSASEEESGLSVAGGIGVMTRGRAPNQSDVSIMQRIARRKAALINPVVSSSTDILDSILDTQSKFHSKNTEFSLDENGKFKMNNKNNKHNNNSEEFKDYEKAIKKRPGYSNGNAPSSTNNYNSGYQNSSNTNYNYAPPPHYSGLRPNPPPPFNYSYFPPPNYGGHDMPQDYTQRTLGGGCNYPPPDDPEKDDKNKNPTVVEPEDVDIYSDIEGDGVSTSQMDEDLFLRPPPTPPVLRTPPAVYDDDNDRDSDPDMVIDTDKVEPEKYDPLACEDSDEDTAEGEEQVSSTVAETIEEKPASASFGGENVADIQIETVQSSRQMFDKKGDDDSRSGDGDGDQDDDSEDGCPNFSIYSKESMNMAIKTDIAMMQQELNNQVGEVSSTPAAETFEKDDELEIPEKTTESGGNEIMPESNQKEDDEKAAPKNIWSDEELPEEPIVQPAKKRESWSTDEAEEVKTPPRTPTPKASICDENSKPKKDVTGWSDDDEQSPVVEAPRPVPRSEWSDEEPETSVKPRKKDLGAGGLYSDSEDENIVKKDTNLKLPDICAMTEEISEEERSYTPCLDEKVSKSRDGIEGLDTEMISDEDRNDFDESHDLKTLSDGDALEINAKECELDFTRPEDYEEGEIVDKLKDQSSSGNAEQVAEEPAEKQPRKETTDHEEIENQNAEPFKKLSKSNKERNYREKDKDKENHNTSKEKNKEKSDRDFRKDKRREKRRELERYDVRALIAEKPRRVKDKFGRDVRKSASRSRSKSHTPQLPPRRSPSRVRMSPVRRIRRERSREIRSLTHSRSRSPRRTSRSKIKKKNARSSSKGRSKRRKSRDKSKKSKKTRSLSRNRSVTPRRRRRSEREPREIEWNDNQNREWTPSLSPSWTPPRMTDVMQPHNLTVILPNDANKKKKEKRKKTDKRNSERGRKRRRIDRTPPPSKEVFASGDNILVSVSFNKENETRDIITTAKRREEEKRKKEKRKRLNRKNADVSGLKPVAIIDLERSPFRVISSPKDIIVLTDSENENIDAANMNTSVNSSQQVASPERCPNNYLTGPKTPPEPQIKFSLNTKQSQLRAINNPLGEPDDLENDMDVQDELEERLNENLYNKGPNTPPEPPNSPPSSPDAYDPFEPTKSRSPTPEPLAVNPPNSEPVLEETREQVLLIESIRTGISEIMDNKAAGLPLLSDSPDILNSHTPPVSEVQPADSQSGLRPATPDSNFEKSPDVSLVITEPSQPQSPSFTLATPKTVAQAPPFSSGQNNVVTSTPVSSSLAPTRINILNNTVITSVAAPQRAVPASVAKTSPVKSATVPAKGATVKSTPVKTTTPKTVAKTTPRKVTNVNRSLSNEVSELLDFDSPYSPGSSDYEDLFEPPPEIVTKPKGKANSKSPNKVQNIFDALFGSGSANKTTKATRTDKGHKHKKISVTPQKGAKMVGVKLDEDSLKILDDLPSSAVEMQVKDKYLKKLYRQERVVEEVKLVLKPYYNKKRINKEEYKDIMRRAVPKICHNKNGEINPTKIKSLIEAYVKKIRHNKKVTSSSNVNSQKA